MREPEETVEQLEVDRRLPKSEGVIYTVFIYRRDFLTLSFMACTTSGLIQGGNMDSVAT